MLPNEDTLLEQFRDVYDQVKAKSELEELLGCPLPKKPFNNKKSIYKCGKVDVEVYCSPRKIEECKLLYGGKVKEVKV